MKNHEGTILNCSYYGCRYDVTNIILMIMTILCFSKIASANNNLIYTMQNKEYNPDSSDEGERIEYFTFDVTDRCGVFFGIDISEAQDAGTMEECLLYKPVLLPFIMQGGHGIHMAMDRGHDGGNPHAICVHQRSVCEATESFQNYDVACTDLMSNCRSALRHLEQMMIGSPPNSSGADSSEQVCNNFARKSIRGFFHDYMSKGIEGSVLDENNVSMNFGLCRWTQYMNVLSDHTQCDPGSIIAMAGELGYLACGVDLYNTDIDVKPLVTLNRPFPCGSNLDDSPLFDQETMQRKEQFSDAQLASNATAMEEFWYEANKHTHGRPDGEIEYSGEAAAAAHAVGRVTCPPDGITNSGTHPNYKQGFFHKPRGNLENKFGEIWWAEPNTSNVNRAYQQALDRFSATQCFEIDEEKHPPVEGKRPSQEVNEGETDLNAEGGLCGMPTQFLSTVRVGGVHRVPRWVAITEYSAPDWPSYSNNQSLCRDQVPMYIPLELLTISDIDIPQSPALDKFLNIAWDGYDSIDSAWDSCVVGCDNPINQNRLCGGDGLEDFDWRTNTMPPTSAPTSSTTTSTCNDPPYKFRITKPDERKVWRDCTWVAQRPENRCAFDGVDSMCASTCRTCDVCVDSTSRMKFYKEEDGKRMTRSCSWTSNRNTASRCQISGMEDACRETCNTCS